MKKMLSIMILAIILVTPTTSLANTETLDAPQICTWKDNKTSAVSIRIDDGLYDSAVVYNQLQKKYGVKSTQMMITNKLDNEDGSINNQLVANWQAIFDDGYMDLGNHSYSHNIKYNNTDTYTTEEMVYDITGSYNLLRRCFPNQEVLFFVPPWGHTKGGSLEEAKKNHYALTKSSTSNPNPSSPKNMFMISAVTSTNTKTVSDMTAWIDNAVTAKGWQVILFHGIETGSSPSTYETLDENVEGLFKYIKQKSDAGDVWSGSLNEVVKYIYERDSATANILETTSNSMKLSLTDTMTDNEIFDYPLTVKVNVPSSWAEEVLLKQGGKKAVSKVFEENGKKYAYVDVIPDGGEIVLENGKVITPSKEFLDKADILINTTETSFELSVIPTSTDIEMNDVGVYLAVYEGNGKLKKLEPITKTEKTDRTVFSGNLPQNEKFKLMVWAYPCTPMTYAIEADDI